MSLPVITVIIPTVAGREDYLERCVAAYTSLAVGAYELDLIIEHDHPSCGAGWQAGLEHAKGEYIHLSDDDIVPQPGWHAPAVEAVDCGFLPAPQVTDPNGYPQSRPQEGVFGRDWTPVDMSGLPFASAAQVEKIAPLFTAHYYCVVPETPVLTAGMEWLPAGKLSIGDEVVGVDEFPEPYEDRRFRRAVVTGNARRVMECVLVRFEDGREVTCSLDHPWLVKTQRRADIFGEGYLGNLRWIEASNLRAGDKISSPIRVWEPETSFDAGWLSGIFDGEGSAGRYGNRRYASTSLSVAQNPGPVLDRMKAVLDAMGVRYNESKNACNSNVTKLRLRTIADVLEVLGRLRPTRLSPTGLWEGTSIRTKAPDQYATVAEVTPAGLCEVAALGTSTGTFLANGLVSHNTDDWFSWRGARAGWQTVLRSDYRFVHLWAQHKRGAGMTQEQRMEHDRGLYREAIRRVLAGEWDAPWPPNGGRPE